MNSPRARTDLLRHRLDEQLVVYDARHDRVHLLDLTTALVLDLLIEGPESPESIVLETRRRSAHYVDSNLVALALEQLRDADLLESELEVDSQIVTPNRREAIQRLTAAGI